MTIILKEGMDTSIGLLEFYLTGLEMPTDFDRVVQSLADAKNLRPYETVEGIFSRTAKFVMDDMHFRVMYHEDAGVYAFSTDNSDQPNEKLRNILGDVVEEMNRNS